MRYFKNFYQIKSNDEIVAKLELEREHIGYYELPYANTSTIKEFAKNVVQRDIVVVGIGGSSLGTYAIHQFLQHKENDKKLHFLESTDPIELQRRLKKIDFDNVLFIFNSKSGSTIETISILKYLHVVVGLDKKNSICISEKDSKLAKFAKENSMRVFEIAKNIGGRFSVFSPVGLVPLAIMGLDIDELLRGCKVISEEFFAKKEHHQVLMEKARFIVENKNKFNINVIFSYSSLLEGFNKWHTQLWGESLGKININGTRQALTPIGIIGPIDQHSFLQLIMDGKRDKTVTFIKVADFKDELTIADDNSSEFKEFDFLNGVKFSQLINFQADATIKAVDELKDIQIGRAHV